MPARPTRDRVIPETDVRPLRRPDWIKVRAPSGETYEWLHGLMRKKELHTVCEEAMCPNLGECWSKKTATFMILGNVCTRRCGFCAVQKGAPLEVDYDDAHYAPDHAAMARQAIGPDAAEEQEVDDRCVHHRQARVAAHDDL